MGTGVNMVDVELRYLRIWRAAVILLAVVGVLAALVFVSPTTNLAVFVVAAFTAGALCLSIGLGRELPSSDLLSTVPRGAVLGGLGVISICGYAAAIGMRTVTLLLLVVGVSPPVVGWLRSGRSGQTERTERTGRTGQTERPGLAVPSLPRPLKLPKASIRHRKPWRRPVPKPARKAVRELAGNTVEPPAEWPMPSFVHAVVRSVGELSDEELCLAWRRSFSQLQRPMSADQRQAMIDVRRAYLDELERRHPESFASWLASNPRAAGNPARFFIHRADH
ncbi:hypothetical protein [Kribbella sp. NPDC048915]|uniref:hypothetical protein n=1 Tax=Kribbella sp. NPDC048915 TaxID=3155148 RepID=UPI0033F16DB8